MSNLLESLKTDKEYLRLVELTNYFKNNEEYKTLNKMLNNIKKQIIKAKVKQDYTELEKLNKLYSNCEETLLNLAFVEEYYELLNIFKNHFNKLKVEIDKFLEESFGGI